jgi:surfeit locus 1 family protein
MPRPLFRRPEWVPTLAAVAGIALTIALGNWQLGRAGEKTAMAVRIQSENRDQPVTLPAAAIDAEDFVWRRIQVQGRFEPKYAVYVDNRIMQGAAGYHVIMPLRIGDGERYVLVNRGWVAAAGTRAQVPAIVTPPGLVGVSGLATVPSRRFLELSTRVADGNVWQNLTLDRYRVAVPIAIQPVVIQQENDLGDGLVRLWPEPDLGIQTHYGYAFQWFALAATILIFYLVTHVRKRSPKQA